MIAQFFLLLALAETPTVPRDAAGIWADPARTALLEPGARDLLSGLSPVSFEGLPPADSAIFFDGLRLSYPAHAFFGPSSISPLLIKGTRIGNGIDLPSRGNTLGRSIELLPHLINRDGVHGAARLDVLSVSGVIEGRMPSTQTTLQLGGRFFGPVTLLAKIFGVNALLGDYQARVSKPFGSNREIRLLAVGAIDSASLTVSGVPVGLRAMGHQIDVAVRPIGEGFESGFTLGYDSVGIDLNGSIVQHQNTVARQSFAARAGWHSRFLRIFTFRLGGDTTLQRVDTFQTANITLPNASKTSVTQIGAGSSASTFAGYSAFGIDLLSFRANLGVRVEATSPSDAKTFVTIDPRVTIEQDIGAAVTLGGSFAVNHQPASWLVTVPALETAALRFGPQEAIRGDFFTSIKVASRHVLRARVFVVGLTRALEFSPFDNNFLELLKMSNEAVQRQKSSGYSLGGELSWRLIDNGRYWAQASYSFIHSQRMTSFYRFDDNGRTTGEDRKLLPWAFLQSHAISAAGGWRSRNGWSLSSTVSFHSGPPQAGGFYAQQQRRGIDAETGAEKWVPTDRDRVALAGAWLRLDARVSKMWKVNSLEIELFLDVQNISIWKQPTGTSYSGETLKTGVASSPIPGPLPMLGVEIRG